ncbi:hypothetical protein Z962_p0043 (plasmid) [Clostridium botulinum C/D str. BKT12695]|nr:hypothetical protein Z962_p0043 [Clostridium botulinum C/D str. BKT12695]
MEKQQNNPILSEREVFNTFKSFFDFSIELIDRIDKDNNYLKFAAVNIQISLELFMKYYFIRIGEIDAITIKKKNGKIKYKDFSDILNYFFNKNNYGNKKELKKILENRNSIVHNGLELGWNKDIALYIINTIFFIQDILTKQFNEGLFEINLGHKKTFKLINNEIWRNGVENSVSKLLKNVDIDIMECPECYTYTLIPKKFLDLSYGEYEKGLVCLNCFNFIELDNSAKLIECFICNNQSYLVDILNEQKNNLYRGTCLCCGYSEHVRKCFGCGKLYHIHKNEEYIKNGKYYCCKECMDIWSI